MVDMVTITNVYTMSNYDRLRRPIDKTILTKVAGLSVYAKSGISEC